VAAEKGLKILIISDSNVDPIYGERYQEGLRQAGFEISRVAVPAGEKSKDLQAVGFLYGQAMAAGLDRSSLILALGGGMVGDLAGFVAATFLRGVRFIQVPTTLLAMVDSSVGGKTAVNLPQGKNLVGAFHQPVEVVADLTSLATLPEREYVSGLAEVVKYGVIWDAAFFKDLESHAERLRSRDEAFLEKVVGRCCEIKAEVVAVDELEVGPRAILNFGHTLAHALESGTGYDRLLHGEAVSLGMVFAARLSSKLKGLPESEAARLVALLQTLGLPVSGSDALGRATDWPKLAWTDIREAMAADKKARMKVPRLVLADRLGSVTTGCEVPDSELMEAWDVIRQ
jgi:3-dehydroquinate synthase